MDDVGWLPVSLMVLLILLGPWNALQSPAQDAEEHDGIHYLDSGSGTLKGPIFATGEEGLICYGCEELVTLAIDGREVPSEILPVGSGKGRVTGTFSDLEDGQHRATQETVGNDGSGHLLNQALFFVDTQPPVLELIDPAGDKIPPALTTFLIRFHDEGSGIPATLEEMDVAATLNGVEAAIHLTQKNGERYLIVTSKGPQWKPDEEVLLYVGLKDRAGHEAELTKVFKAQVVKEKWELESVKCGAGGRYLYVLKQIPFPLLSTPKCIVFHSLDQAVLMELELGTLEEQSFDHGFFEALTMTSNHPAIEVERLDRPSDSASIRFRITQNTPVVGGDNLTSVIVQYPAAVVFDHNIRCKGNEAVTEIVGVSSAGPLLRLDVPVSLYFESDHSDGLEIKEDTLTYSISFDTPGGLDTAASWFELDHGERLWFQGAGNGNYEASTQAMEGHNTWEVALTTNLGLWRSVPEGQEVIHSGTCLKKGGQTFIRLAPPVIENFHYDRDKEQFWAVISDRGTALEDLAVELNVTGQSILPELDPVSGGMTIPFDMPDGVQGAVLRVTDKADQTTTARCLVFGKTPPKKKVPATKAEYPVEIKQSTRIAEKRPTWINRWTSKEYLSEYKDGKQLVRMCTDSEQIHKVEAAYSGCLHRRFALEGINLRSPTGIAQTGRLPLWKRKRMARIYEECRKEAGILKVPRYPYDKKVRPSGIGARWIYIPEIKCKEGWEDTLAPRIREVTYHPDANHVTAFIHDHGMPLADLKINFRVTRSFQTPYGSFGVPFSFDTASGFFNGNLANLSECEKFTLEIRATDRAGNTGYAYLDITRPNKPPDVSILVTRDWGGAQERLAYPVGECFDVSGIDHARTRLWLDGRAIPPFSVELGRATSSDKYYFGAVMEEGEHSARFRAYDNLGLSSEDSVLFKVSYSPRIQDFKALPTTLQLAGGPAFSALVKDPGGDLRKEGIAFDINGSPVSPDRLFYDLKSGYVAVDGPFDLSPGRHLAHITAVDDHGNRAEDWLGFFPGETIAYDLGGEGIDLEAVTLWELEDHNGDGRANPGEFIRLFVTLKNTGQIPLQGVTGRIESEDELIVVEEDRVDYGSMPAGEAPLPLDGFDVRISEDLLNTTARDPYDAPFRMNVKDENGRTWQFPFTVPIYIPTIPVEASSQGPPQNDLQGTGDESLPPVSAISAVTVNMDDLPPTTDQETIEVSGTATSSASVIDQVTVSVNGNDFVAAWDGDTGRFTVDVNLDLGANVIQVRAVDQSGAMGMDNDFINRTEPFIPPGITIDNPTEGQAVHCSGAGLSGTFDAGSSTVANIQAVMTGNGDTINLPLDWDEGEGTFQSEEGDIPFPGSWENQGVIDVEITVVITTTDGDTATVTVSFTYECWS